MRLVFLFILSWSNFSMADGVLKRISITSTNNSPSFIIDSKWVVEKAHLSDLKNLKDYAMQSGFKPSETSEQELVLSALKWVNAQWEHDGMNQPPSEFSALDVLKSVHKDKKKYRCVEYGIVLAELLQAYGFITRTVALRSMEVAYGGFGQGHVAMEVWMNDLNKWIFLDPQFGLYITRKDSKDPLNFLELFQNKQAGKWDQLIVNFVSDKSDSKSSADYKNFLKNYFGHMKVSSGKNSPGIGLLLESKEMPLTFQGTASNKVIFTQDVSYVYPEMNRVALFLSYQDESKDFKRMMSDLKINSDESYLKNMPKFAAKPNFVVTVNSSISDLKGYEYRFSRTDKWTFSKDPEFKWNATKTDNVLEVRAINGQDRRGPITFIEIKYQ